MSLICLDFQRLSQYGSVGSVVFMAVWKVYVPKFV